jgi:uncharacterized protein (TIGR01777 family)
MKVLISGASGLVGSALDQSLQERGHHVVALVRDDRDGVHWNPQAGAIDADGLEGFDAVVHLAGESIADGRWNDAKKRHIRDSRIKGTRLLAESLAACDHKPAVLVCASAIGFYGDRGDEPLDESAKPGDGFLPQVCVQWEQATQPAADAGIRVVNLRIGIVLSGEGGALAKMLTPFKMGVGGVLGPGKQYMSWIERDDLVSIIEHTIADDSLIGQVNAVAPQAVTNHTFTKTLGRVLSRPTIFPMPAFAARLAFGEMADALLLASTRVVPVKLQQSGFTYQHANLEPALRHLLDR